MTALLSDEEAEALRHLGTTVDGERDFSSNPLARAAKRLLMSNEPWKEPLCLPEEADKETPQDDSSSGEKPD